MSSQKILLADSISTGIWPEILGERGRVLSVHEHALNLLFSPKERLVAVVPQAAGKLPNAILYRMPSESGFSFDSLGLKPGFSVIADQKSLSIPAVGLVIDLCSAKYYPAKPALKACLDSWPDVMKRVALAVHQARQGDAHRGLLPLLAYINEIEGSTPAPEDDLTALCSRAWVYLQALLRCLRDESAAEVRNAVTNLMGLGIGLTPSGDDVLVGLMGFLYHSPGTEIAACLLSGAIAEAPAGRTNLISRSYLIHAARGEISDRLGCFIDSLIGGTIDEVGTSLRDLMSWGHTSGAETALGVLLAAVLAGYTTDSRS